MCGIKGSLCTDTNENNTTESENDISFTSVSTDLLKRVETNTISQPFAFVDLVDGLWSLTRSGLYQLHPIVHCPINGTVIFYYPNYSHDVVKMADETHYEACNFTESIELSPIAPQMQDDAHKYPYMTYYHQCKTPGALEYISCSIPGHCEAGQKIAISTSDSTNVYDDNNTMVLHVDQISRILTVMGYFTEPGCEFAQMPLGYQTEVIAEKTKEWVWCGLEHCPNFNDISVDENISSKQDDCIAAGNLLLGFIERSKPIPDFEKSEEYYQKAIDAGGINECAARSYQSKMFLDKKDYFNATKAATVLCQVCGNGAADDLHGVSVRQAKSEFDAIAAVWPCAEKVAPLSSSAPSIFHFESCIILLLIMTLIVW